MAVSILLIAILLLVPSHAYAWGIGFHLQVGQSLLENINQIAPQLAACLQAFPQDFLYGCISADITLGKKHTHYLQHCHSWRVARQVIAAADSDSRRACAYGYLSHLAMDTIAHSYFVPYKMMRTFNTLALKHTYWEMRIEAEIDPKIWAMARTIGRKEFSDNDRMLRGVIADTIFSFGTNKKLFNSLLLLNRLQQWQKMLRSLNRNSKWTIAEADLQEYFQLAREAASSILGGDPQSPYWKADPAGERALHVAGMIRRNLYLLWLDGKLPPAEADALLAELKPQFRAGITAPDSLLELLSGF